MNKLKPTLVPALGWLSISTILLTIPGSAFPKDDWLNKIWFDKWVHLGMFSIMVVLWCWGWGRYKQEAGIKKKVFAWIALVALAYGAGMEFVQHYLVVNRSFDTGDIIADAAGCGLGLVYSLGRYIKK